MDRMNSVETGARIAALRKERGMTQRDLAQPVGVSDKAVSKWERGECFPDVTLFPRLAALFEVDLEELMGQGDAGEIPDSARGGQTKTALLLKNSFCDGQLSGNLKTLLLPFLTVFCGGFLGGSYAALLTGVCFLLQLMWTLWFLGRQRREAQYLREKYGQSFVGKAPLRYGAALAGASLALCALFFVSAAQEKLAVRIPELIAGELHIAFLRLDGRQTDVRCPGGFCPCCWRERICCFAVP